MKFLSGVVLGVVAAGLGAVALVASGVIDPAASVAPSALETRIARFALDHAVARRAPRSANPLKADGDVLRGGMAHYKSMCVTCHGAPGVDASEAGAGLNPPAPDLTLGRVQKRTDGELFWVVQNGIRMSGMPAFGPTHKDEEIWKIVAFLRHLPALTPEEEKALEAGARSGDGS
ncbi:MAG TPA: cytochrome c [Thermoanaerobaculia bacterium]|jgi:mono/diheme cytochrome c family protein|nr:cytochrome c [Thermoanaerobaculia bacterium]